ncbi:hypothetical protein [Rhizobium sp. CC-YZS058]|uniref:ABC transporter permease n=1 Tax=Rhizobium sp. CC-YZS058 TaxID=3042153 RepID=UPI002B062598|nr:hypothetical protein [Rhizobium sp. CC-YZS058]MEA3537083.1 hypothetical protein [Rhizobium sp. CC-YZS058]
MLSKKPTLVLLAPALMILIAFLVAPMLIVANESVREFVPGRVGASEGALVTVANYTELLNPVYATYFLQTYLIASLSALLAILVSFPVANYVARHMGSVGRRISISALIGLMFLSSTVRIYAIQLTFGSVSGIGSFIQYFGYSTNSNVYVYMNVFAGLLHYQIPLSILIISGAIMNLSPRYMEAAQSLGASRCEAHFNVTIPLCVDLH